ncbi:MAG TPA: hypothetical protein VD905_12600 [Flavobacteriales bacterium]|nr:hypothetical protein [Flavobacteriales bacterium]
MKLILFLILAFYTYNAFSDNLILAKFRINGETLCLYNKDGFLAKGKMKHLDIEFISQVSEEKVKNPRFTPFPDRRFEDIFIYGDKYQIVHNNFLIDGDTLLTTFNVRKMSIPEWKLWDASRNNINKKKLSAFLGKEISDLNEWDAPSSKNVKNKLYYDYKNGYVFLSNPGKENEDPYVSFNITTSLKINPQNKIIDFSFFDFGQYTILYSVFEEDDNIKSSMYIANTKSRELKAIPTDIEYSVLYIKEIVPIGKDYLVFGNLASKEKLHKYYLKKSPTLPRFPENEGYFFGKFNLNEQTVKINSIYDFTKQAWFDSKFYYEATLSYFNQSTNKMLVTINIATEHGTGVSVEENSKSIRTISGLPYVFLILNSTGNNSNPLQEKEIQARYTKKSYEPELDDFNKDNMHSIIAHQGHLFFNTQNRIYKYLPIQNNIFNNMENPVKLVATDLKSFIYETGNAYYMVTNGETPSITVLDIKFKNANGKGKYMDCYLQLFNNCTIENTTLYNPINETKYLKRIYDNKGNSKSENISY